VTGPVTTTWLELDGPAALRPARPPRVPGVAIARVRPPDGALNRRLYAAVGAAHAWTDHAHADAAWWQAHAEAAETWLLTVAGADAGYAELVPGTDPGAGAGRGADVELGYFGLVPEFHGRGLGGLLLTRVLRRGLELAPRVWLHTCSLDGPGALPNYLARGLRPYRRETSSAPGRGTSSSPGSRTSSSPGRGTTS
jgi:GNAT superfamily N-acetyltransferase